MKAKAKAPRGAPDLRRYHLFNLEGKKLTIWPVSPERLRATARDAAEMHGGARHPDRSPISAVAVDGSGTWVFGYEGAEWVEAWYSGVPDHVHIQC